MVKARTAGFGLALALMTSAAPAVLAQSAPQTLGLDAAWRTLPPRPSLNFSETRVPSRAQVQAAADYVARAQIADMARHPLPLATGSSLREAASNWVAATFYVGAARHARFTKDPEILRFLGAVAEHYNYGFRGGRSAKGMLNADELAIGGLYQELYMRRGQEGTLMPLQQRVDYQVPHLARTKETESLVWWWCDALFMAPPVLAQMSRITGDPKYVMAMDKEWRRTDALLWNPAERLYARDARFKARKSERGNPIFWSRGNGWVLAGLARTLEALPESFAGRDFYVERFKALAMRATELQKADGLWPASLRDPQAFPEAETSGSAMLTYGLAWGINHGLLDRAKVQPHVLRGWAALNRQILPNGMLGSVQKTGDQPVPTMPEDTGPYGTGGYLLAGSEVARLGEGVRDILEPLPARDDARTVAATTHNPPPPTTIVGDAEKKRRSEEVRATRALSYDPDTLNRPASVEQLTPPTGDDRRVRALAHYAPERFDDILWENDKVALRIYGPALEAREPPSSSGIDIWAKRTRWPFMRRQLKFPNYHVDRGEGLDYYDVGGSRGVGGLGIWQGNKLWNSRNWASHRITKADGNEAAFEVSYKPWPVDLTRKVWETRSFSLPMGSNFTRLVSKIDSDSKEPLIVAIGIAKRKSAFGTNTVVREKALGRLTVQEAVDPARGSMMMTIAVDPAMVQGFAEDADNYLMLVRVDPGTPFAYYSGYAWDRGLDIHNLDEWQALVRKQRFDFKPR